MRNLFYLGLFAGYLILIYQIPEIRGASILQNPIVAFGLIIMGAALSAVTSDRFSLTAPRFRIAYGQSLVGGILIGLGLSLAGLPLLGNVLVMTPGIFYWASFLLSQGLIYLLGMFIGGGTAVYLIKYGYPRLNLQTISGDSMTKTVQTVRPIIMAAAFLLVIYLIKELVENLFSWLFLIIILAPVLGGFLMEKNRICMALMMKEIFLTGRFITFYKVFFIIITMVVIWQSFGIDYTSQLLSPTWLSLLGAFFMGFGYVIAEGCFMGSLWKAGQGNLLSFVTLGGIFLGGAIAEVSKKLPNQLILKQIHISLSMFQSLIWYEVAIKLGLTIILFAIITNYFINPPAKIKARGTSWKWLLSDAVLVLTIGIIIKTSQGDFSQALRVMGTIIFYLAVVLYCWARIELGKYWSQGIVLRKNHQIIKTGPYQWLKHPIYWAVFTGVFGGSFMVGSILGIAAVVVLVGPTLYIRAKEEEKLLSSL